MYQLLVPHKLRHLVSDVYTFKCSYCKRYTELSSSESGIPAELIAYYYAAC